MVFRRSLKPILGHWAHKLHKSKSRGLDKVDQGNWWKGSNLSAIVVCSGKLSESSPMNPKRHHANSHKHESTATSRILGFPERYARSWATRGRSYALFLPVMLRPPAQPQPQTPHCNTGDCVSSSPCNPWNFLPLPWGIWCQLMSPDPGLLWTWWLKSMHRLPVRVAWLGFKIKSRCAEPSHTKSQELDERKSYNLCNSSGENTLW